MLLALPVLAGRAHRRCQRLIELGEQLGSDVPFFLLGGTAAGIGRGTELFPLPDAPAAARADRAPGVHVNTPRPIAASGPRLTTESQQNKIVSFQSRTVEPGASCVSRRQPQRF